MNIYFNTIINQSEAITYDENVDLPTWISTLSSKQDAVPYGD